MERAAWEAERERALGVLRREGVAPRERAKAADGLVRLVLEDRHLAPELRREVPGLLADRQPEVRRAGVGLAAALLPAAELREVLGPRTTDEDVAVRLEAVGQLADQASPESRSAFARGLEDASPEVRFEAARGMAALKHPAGLDVLVRALDVDALRFRALGALAELGDVRALPALRRLFGRWLLPGFERTQTAGALARLGDAEAAAWLVERSRKRRGVDRPLAVELCGEVKAPGALERLREVLLDPRDDARGAAARGLGRLGDAAAEPWLLQVLEEPAASDDVRLDAAEGLVLLKARGARERITAVLPRFASADARAEVEALLEEAAQEEEAT